MASHFIRSLLAVGVCAVSLSATAAPIFSLGGVVTQVDRSATFSSLVTWGNSLANYTENGLSITDSNVNYLGFGAFQSGDARTSQFWYPSGGDNNYADIKGTDDAVFSAIDFLVGNGQFGNTTNLRWVTLMNNQVTGTGLISGLAKGQVIGFKDVSGFDELRVAAAISSADPGFGNHQSIAIDDLRAQLATTAAASVPEPTSIALLGLGLLGMVFGRRKQA